MSEKLKIYACSGLGIGATNRAKEWIAEGTSAATNTQAMNSMLSYINLLATELRNPDIWTKEEYLYKLNEFDLACVCFYYARLFKDNTEKLSMAGKCIAEYKRQDGFNSNNSDVEWHEQHVDKIIDDIDAMLLSDDKNIDPEVEFVDWWQKEVVEKNVVGLSDGRVGATITTDYGDLNKYLYDGGTYFLYLYIPEKKRASLPYRIRKKIRKQQEVYDYCKKCFCPEYGGIYGSEADMQRVIRAGIIEDFKQTPENIAKDIVDKISIGQLSATVIAAIITAVTTLVIAILGLIINYASAVAAAKYAEPEDPQVGMAEGDDFMSAGTTDWGKWILFGGIGLLVLLGLNKD